MRRTALSSILAGTAAATLAAGCGGAKDSVGETAKTPPNVVGLRVPGRSHDSDSGGTG